MSKGNRIHAALLCAAITAVAATLIAGCGGSSDESTDPTGEAARPSASDFPAVDGRTLEELAKDEGTPSDLVAAPAGQVYRQGENRYGFGIFNVDASPVDDAEVALYLAPQNDTKGPAEGPYPAAAESLEVQAAFQSQTTSSDPDAATTVYVSDVDFPKDGPYRMVALIKDGDSYQYTQLLQGGAVVGAFPDIPEVGDKAPVVHTDTPADVGGDVSKIDTRQPPTTMHSDDYADVVGKKPVVLLFATPALCQSRVCGPVADITEEVKNERPDDAAYIMQEIYVDNVPGQSLKNLRPQVRAFGLRTEPWLFVIDEDGNISTEIEGAFSKGELEAALDKVTGADSETTADSGDASAGSGNGSGSGSSS